MSGERLAPQHLAGDAWRVCRVDDLPEGAARSALVDDVPIAVVRHQGRLAAIGACCPHQGADLSEGVLEPEGTIACGLHLWSFDLGSGRCTMIEGVATPVFPVREEDGWVVVSTTPVTS